ncbi:SDR family NAD(P)-dependent oxidoreductase [Sciscionella sediminilitoris]|uniref:SDR family NAD(P)-dependent oxidoreductase n=1 Tax=Sciscionella sediminilitoris TaxID=1445613 RepID=UPI0004DF14A2|nr:SDR family NAD(P)-dependent oxidoreductase [Sciscionella sp. SE31]
MGQIAVITGGTAGIGLACAEKLHEEGATVVMSGRSAERGRKAVARLGSGERARYIPCDVTDPRQIVGLIEETVDEHRRIDVLINSAGGVTDDGRLVEQQDDEALTRAFDLNVNSAFLACRAALPHMLPRGYGRIINMSSLAGKTGVAGLVGYTTAKHALIGYTKTLAKEVTARGVTVNAVCPGITDTEMVSGALRNAIENSGADFGEAAAHYTGDLGRMVEPAEVAVLVATLVSAQSGAISGTAFSLDGGFSQF